MEPEIKKVAVSLNLDDTERKLERLKKLLEDIKISIQEVKTLLK